MKSVSAKEASERRQRSQSLVENSRSLPESRVAVLGTFNLDLLPSFLRESMDRAGLFGELYLGGFGQIAQEVFVPDSGLYQFNPDTVIIIPAVEDVLGAIYERPAKTTPEQSAELIQAKLAELDGMIRALLEKLPAATCYVVAFSGGWPPSTHLLNPSAVERGQSAVEQYLTAIRELPASITRTVVVDWDWHLRLAGAVAYSDDRLWYLVHMRLNQPGTAALADLITEHIAAYKGLVRKVVVADLDNTLWGGIIGEVGLAGLTLGSDGIGLAFQDVQRELLRLNDLGILLAICSKNNPDDVWEVFQQHQGMILKQENFAAVRVNWQDKATNLAELAEELNVGLDSFVFLDDNPVERGWVSSALPQVLVPELPADVAYWPQFLRELPYFRRIQLTDADLKRAATYRAQGFRRELLNQSGSMDTFLASLEQKVIIEPVNDGSVARAAQMCQRTNQFNLTTKRYTTADIERMRRDPSFELLTVSVKDRFGDSGITGLVILAFKDDTAEIDTLLLSCRVLGRKVEEAVLATLTQRALARKMSYLVGHYVPTAKNKQTASFYPDRGFETVSEGVYCLDLTGQTLTVPMFITLETK